MSTTPSGASRSNLGAPFIGRGPELAALRNALDSTIEGSGRLILISGEPGIGKTRLAEWIASAAWEADLAALWGRCYEGEGAPAYWPWSQILRGILPLNDPDTLQVHLGPDAAHLAQIVPEIEKVLPDLNPLPAMNPEQARFRLFDAVTRVLKQRAAEGPLAVIFEDLHWADEPSLLLLQFLASELRGSRLLVISTYRDVEVQRQHPLSATLASLVREPVTQRITLHRFRPDEVGELIEQFSGTPPAEEMVQAVWRETEGNPFFVTEVIRLLQVQNWSQRTGNVLLEIRIPESIREVVGQRLDRLSPECNELLAVAAVVGREFDLPILEFATAKEGIDLLPLLDEALRSQMIEDGHSFGRYRFSHRLIQETLYAEIPTSRRFQLHSRIGAAIEDRYADLQEHFGTLAHHYARAPLGPNIEKAIDYATRAAERAMLQVAWEQAVSSYELALQMLELQPDTTLERRCELLLALGSAQDSAGSGRGNTPGTVHASDARATFWQAVENARSSGSTDHLARAAIGLSYGFFAGVPSTDERIAELLEEILEDLPDDQISTERILIQANLAATYRAFQMFSGIRLEHASEQTIEQLSSDAVRQSDLLGDLPARLISRVARHTAIGHPDRLDELQSLIDEILDFDGSGIPDQYDVQTAIVHAAIRTEMAKGNVAAGKRLVDRMIAHHRDTTARISDWSAKVFQAGISLCEGRFTEAETFMQAADSVWPNTGIVCNQLFALYREQDQLEAATPRLTAILESFPRSPWLSMIWILYLLETGEREEARQRFQLTDLGDLTDLARGGYWSHVVAICSELSIALEDQERAGLCYELLEPFSDHVIYCSYIYYCAGSVSHYLGRLASFLGEWQQADTHFAQALEQHQSMGFQPLAAYTRLEWARMLLKRGEASDREQANNLLDQAVETARRLGMLRLERLARELNANTRSDTGDSPAGLSPRETEVIELVVEGLSNPEIGERLYISPRTVSQHLRSVFNKLDVNNRAAAVARWVELAHRTGGDSDPI